MHKSLVVLFLFISSTLVFGQVSKTLYDHLNEENGLAQNFVYGITKDVRGFVWISTGNGLTRYDGKSVKNYTIADGLASNFITSSFKTKDGRILFGHFQGSITAYNGAFFGVLIGDTLNSEVVSMVETRDQTIFCATRSNGFSVWDSTYSEPTFIFPSQLQGKIVNQIKIIGNQLLAATSEGLYIFQVQGKNLVFNEAPETLLYEDILSIGPDKQDSIRCWLGTNGNGLYKIRTGTFTKVEQHITSAHLYNTAIRAIVNDQPSSVWIGTHQKGLFHFEVANDSILTQAKHFDEDNGYPIFSTNCLLIEPNNVMWVGTLSQGLVKLYDPLFLYYDASPYGVEHVNAIAEGDQQYYLATDKGLYTIPHTERYKTNPFQQFPFLKKEAILSLKFIKGILWIGTQDNGIYTYDEKKNKISNFVITDNDLTPVKVRIFEPDKNGNIWISAMGEGVMLLDDSGNVLRHLATNTGFIHNDIYTICADTKGNVWFGSLGAGLAKLLTDGTLHRLSQQDIFPSHDINDIIEDNGTIWIATDGQGYFKQQEDLFIRVGPTEKSESPFIKSLQADHHDRVWLSTRRSIGYLDYKIGKSRQYDKHDGLIEKENYASSLFLDSKENLLVTNDRGVTIFNTQQVGRQVILDTYLTNISISFEPYAPPTPTKLEMAKGLYPSVNLNYDQNHVTFEFQAVDTDYPGRVYYRYYLEALEPSWSPPSQSNSITYTSLEPGTYFFHAQATNDLGAWTDKTLNYTFVIDHPYWDSWWFYLLQIAGVLILFGGTFQLIRSPATKRSLGRVMVFMCIFIVFDYFQNWMEPITPDFIGSVPLYKTLLNLCLALALFPVERGIKKFFKKQELR